MNSLSCFAVPIGLRPHVLPLDTFISIKHPDRFSDQPPHVTPLNRIVFKPPHPPSLSYVLILVAAGPFMCPPVRRGKLRVAPVGDARVLFHMFPPIQCSGSRLFAQVVITGASLFIVFPLIPFFTYTPGFIHIPAYRRSDVAIAKLSTSIFLCLAVIGPMQYTCIMGDIQQAHEVGKVYIPLGEGDTCVVERG